MKQINLKNYLIKNFKLLIISLIIFFTVNLSNATSNFETNFKKEIYSKKLSQLELDNMGDFFKKLDKDFDNRLTFEEIIQTDFIYKIQLNKFDKLVYKKKFYPKSHKSYFENENFSNFFKKNRNFFYISDKNLDSKLDKREFLNALVTNFQLLSFLNRFLYSLDEKFNYHQYDFYNAKINYFLLNEFLILKNNFIVEDTDYPQKDQDKDYLFYYTFLDLYEIAIQK